MNPIDLHNHVIPLSIINELKNHPEVYKNDKVSIEQAGEAITLVLGKKKFPMERELYDADAKVEAMERKGVHISAISPAPLVFFYGLNADDGLAAACIVNDGVAQMVAARPDRLRGMATLPMQDPDAAIAELERVVRNYGFKAVELGTAIMDTELSDPKLRPVLRRIQELKVVLFAHSNVMGTSGRLDCYYLTNLIGNPLDTTIMVGKLMFSGVLDELKELKILLAHGGGFVPYQIGRFEHGHSVRPDTAAVTQTKPLEMLKRFYFDALTHHPQATRHLLNIVGSERVVIGTDSPYDMGEERPIQSLDAVPGLTSKEREDVLFRSALGLFDGTL